MSEADKTTELTRAEIEALLNLAKAATPGPWVVSKEPGLEPLCAVYESGDTEVHLASFVAEYDAAFIAAANPAVLQAICTMALKGMDVQPSDEFTTGFRAGIDAARNVAENERNRLTKMALEAEEGGRENIADRYEIRATAVDGAVCAISALSSLPEPKT